MHYGHLGVRDAGKPALIPSKEESIYGMLQITLEKLKELEKRIKKLEKSECDCYTELAKTVRGGTDAED
jgi:hypothetical protein